MPSVEILRRASLCQAALKPKLAQSSQAEHTDRLQGTRLAGAPLEPGRGKPSTPDFPPANL